MDKFRAGCNCGFKTVLKIESKRFAHTIGPLIFPFFCKNCDDLVELSLYEGTSFSLNDGKLIPLDERKLNCPKCNSGNILPYDHKDIGEEGSHTHYHKYSKVLKRGVELTNGKYKCPRCKKMTLGFCPPFLMVD